MTVNKYARGKFLKLSFIDFKTDCSKRNRLWVKEGGRTKFTKVCGKREIPDYISRLGRVTVGLDFGNDAQALVSYQAVSPREFLKIKSQNEKNQKKVKFSKKKCAKNIKKH